MWRISYVRDKNFEINLSTFVSTSNKMPLTTLIQCITETCDKIAIESNDAQFSISNKDKEVTLQQTKLQLLCIENKHLQIQSEVLGDQIDMQLRHTYSQSQMTQNYDIEMIDDKSKH